MIDIPLQLLDTTTIQFPSIPIEVKDELKFLIWKGYIGPNWEKKLPLDKIL